jgi:N-acetylglucosaminylphosphatidylinositol deacetylase
VFTALSLRKAITPSQRNHGTMATLLVILAAGPLLLLATWHLTSSLTTSILFPPASLRKKRIILLIAHPDDEAMFFAPTLQALTAPHLGNHVKILCLSTGDADGLGAIRSKELIKSALMLGVRKPEDVYVMDDPRFQDGMQNEWKQEDVCRVLGMAFAPQIVSGTSTPTYSVSPQATETDIGKDQEQEKEKDKKERRKSKHVPSKPPSTAPIPTPAPTAEPLGPRATIDVLITFDAHGISSHPNHKALHTGALAFLTALMHGHAGWKCPVTLYTLPTVNIARKYCFVFDALTTMANGALETLLGGGRSKLARAEADGNRALFISDMARYWRARNAMVRGHQSQMVWFRWGWISMGRYMVVNDLKRERVVGG